jgi:hypothetical protein
MTPRWWAAKAERPELLPTSKKALPARYFSPRNSIKFFFPRPIRVSFNRFKNSPSGYSISLPPDLRLRLMRSDIGFGHKSKQLDVGTQAWEYTNHGISARLGTQESEDRVEKIAV